MKKKYAEKLKDPRWQKKRLEIMDRDGFKCHQCGDGESTLNVHHIKYEGDNPWDTSDQWMKTLCEKCHSIAHDKYKPKNKNSYRIKVYPPEQYADSFVQEMEHNEKSFRKIDLSENCKEGAEIDKILKMSGRTTSFVRTIPFFCCGLQYRHVYIAHQSNGYLFFIVNNKYRDHLPDDYILCEEEKWCDDYVYNFGEDIDVIKKEIEMPSSRLPWHGRGCTLQEWNEYTGDSMSREDWDKLKAEKKPKKKRIVNSRKVMCDFALLVGKRFPSFTAIIKESEMFTCDGYNYIMEIKCNTFKADRFMGRIEKIENCFKKCYGEESSLKIVSSNKISLSDTPWEDSFV